ncbi:MAG: hypothetical protein K0Q72_4169 [Armatimonadetes bacterium]|nr:hypothetical protein [Armatimonadota bacterium]
MSADPLAGTPDFPDALRQRLAADYDRFRETLPSDLRAHCLDAYGVDIQGEYAGAPIANPFGKASGQLSLNVRQVRRDAEAGLGFVVLKTVIAQDEQGASTMSEWAIQETRMRLDRITGADGTPGWSVTWKGRGWHQSFEDYCRFYADALEAAAEHGTRIAASVKYHLPGPDGGAFSVGEYEYTTRRLLDVWRARHLGPMPLEKDFSPTLAGDDRSRQEAQILHWLRTVPQLIQEPALSQDRTPNPEHRISAPPEHLNTRTPERPVSLGVKLMNAQAGLDFQVEMIRTLVDEALPVPDYLVYANRLFDPDREFEGKRGIAYGGPDLRQRNLEALAQTRRAAREGRIQGVVPPISATGDILTGRAAVEYGLLGASSCQMHTVFQLPDSEFDSGLVAWLLHLRERYGRPVHWRDLPGLGAEQL